MAINHDKGKGIEVDEIDGLPHLTARQLNFVMELASGKNKSDAYRSAYNCKNTTPRVIWKNASELASDRNVKVWIEHSKREAYAKLLDETSYTLDKHVQELNDVIELSKAAGNYATMASAILNKGRCCNHYIEHKVVTNVTQADQTLIDKLEILLGHDAAMHAASNLGLPIQDKHLDS